MAGLVFYNTEYSVMQSTGRPVNRWPQRWERCHWSGLDEADKVAKKRASLAAVE